MKSAVLYYSRSNKTAIAANALADKVSGDLIEIKDLKSRKGILGYIRAALDARGDKTTSIEPSSFDTSTYDRIYLGTPVWAGKPAPAINTVIDSFNIDGKEVVLFTTLGGSNYSGAIEKMESRTKANGANVVKTFAITNTGKKSNEDIKNEINNMNLGS